MSGTDRRTVLELAPAQLILSGERSGFLNGSFSGSITGSCCYSFKTLFFLSYIAEAENKLCVRSTQKYVNVPKYVSAKHKSSFLHIHIEVVILLYSTCIHS